jgi:uncharacterized protein YyaL (SSP411 family)
MANRLADSTSPYLLQHADNPVDWWQWSDEAFAEARRRDVPVLLSIGYAACHWCHVMAHESFEDETTAAEMNEQFVNIKVDREERPDVDSVYMEATQALTGQGGWPMTCFLTPDGKPFHCGTYYPPEPKHGMPSFRQLLRAVVDAWNDRGEEVRAAADNVATELAKHSAPLPPAGVDADAVAKAVESLQERYDQGNGGFGSAPKFPPSMVLEFLLRHYERTGSAEALSIVEFTTEKMARGGIYDQLAGGFARYSVDAEWIVPHFEKMLYDNGLLLRAYAHLARRTGSGLASRVTEQTAEFLLTDLRTPQGGFAAALDADTEGVEGLTYVWTPEQLTEVLGEDDGKWAAEVFGVTEAGTFEHGSSTLRLLDDPADTERLASVRERLLAARKQRPQPALDDKVVTAWNGMVITALAEAGASFGRDDWIKAAEEAADFMLRTHVVDGRLRRTSRHGAVGTAAGVLEDYGCLAGGLLAVHQATGAARWLDAACELIDTALAHFAHQEADSEGAFHDTADDAEELMRRPSDPTDNATPSGASTLADALLSASVLAGHEAAERYRDHAEAAVHRAGMLAARAASFAGNWLAVAEALLAGPVQVAVSGPAGDRGREALAHTAFRLAHGGAVVVAGEPEAEGVPLLADRPMVDGNAAAYVCRGYVCDRPVADPQALEAALT